MKRFLQLSATLLIGGLALYFVFKDIHWDELVDELGKVDYPVFFLGTALFGGLHVSRSVRWGRLVQAIKPEVGFRSYFSICSIGFFLITVLPFRLGEFARPYLLLEREEVPFGSGMATVLVERVLDVAALGLIFIGVLLWGIDDVQTTPLTIDGREYDIVQLGRTAILAVLIPFGGAIGALLLMGDRGVDLARRLFRFGGHRFAELVAGFLSAFLHAVRSLGSRRAAAQQVFWTFFAWGVNCASIWVMAMAFPFGADMGFWDGATILVCVCIVLIVPPPPGAAGVFEWAVAICLTQLYGRTMTEAAAFGVLVHIAQVVLLTGLGVWFLSVDKISLGRLIEGMKGLRASPAPSGTPPA